MARTRYLKPGFFANDKLAEFSPWHRLLFAGLWTLADRSGRLEDRPKKIKGQLFPFDDVDVDALLSDLAKGDDPFVIRYESAGVPCIVVPKFLVHQRPHGKEPASTLLGPNSPKLGAKTQSRDQVSTNPTKPAPEPEPLPNEPDLNLELDPLNLIPSMGNGERESADSSDPPVWKAPEPRTPTLVEPRRKHARCYDAPLACKRGICVPGDLGRQWEAQAASGQPPEYSASGYVVTFINGTLQFTPAGPIADDGWKWWKAQWAEKHGATKANTPRVYAAVADWSDECAAHHNGGCDSRYTHGLRMQREAVSA